MEKIVESSLCTGCMACKQICPCNAIEGKYDLNGFIFPEIDQKKCINCGMCISHCPQVEPFFRKNDIMTVYAGMASDEVRFESSSGGTFFLCAEMIIKRNGYVCGAILDVTTCSVKHILSNRIEDVKQMCKSKYVESYLGNVFEEIKEKLMLGFDVLFSGTPCQVAGLYSYLGKEYEKLLTIDLICFGIPSEKVFRKYVAETIGFNNLNSLNMRSKVDGWSPDYVWEINNQKFIKSYENYYLKAFLSRLSIRESCGRCKYATEKRNGDITLGDFWWIEKKRKKLNDDKGTSLIIVSSVKGKLFIKNLRSSFSNFCTVPKKWITNINFRKSIALHPKRDQFLANLDKKKLKKNYIECIEDKVDVCLINMWWATSNYGALLTGYAFQQILLKMGYTSKLINNISLCPDQLNNYEKTFNYKFKEKYLQVTDICYDDFDFFNLNKIADIFICGSDQVFAPKWMKSQLKYYMLDFVNVEKIKVAYSASYGVSEDEFRLYGTDIIEKMKRSLKTFDYISTREKSGINTTKNLFNLEADFTLDPVFLVDKGLFYNLVKDANLNYKNKIVSYILDRNPDYEQVFDRLSNKYKLEIVETYGSNLDVEDWLSAISSCEYFITDSFHGFCFALIFNKPLILVKNALRGSERFDALLEIFEIVDFSVPKISSLNSYDVDFITLDYEKINKRIEFLRKESLDKLEEVLSMKKDLTNEKIASYIDLLNYNCISHKASYSLFFIIKRYVKRVLIKIKRYLR